MPERILAIGDIHGCSTALAALLDAVQPRPGDTLVALGDYVDRGPDSRGVIDLLLDAAARCRLVPLLGNHEEMLLYHCEHWSDGNAWLMYGGQATLDSYGVASPAEIPPAHLEFLQRCVDWFETERHFFVHACYAPGAPLGEQNLQLLRWESLRWALPGPHVSGKTAIVGHTAQRSGAVLDVGYLKCIDTWCYGGGWLTALDVETGAWWQTNERGERREGALPPATE
jgi:serine/threonine protein phosphatase 1